MEQREQPERSIVNEATESQKGVEARRRGIEEILAQEVSQRAEALDTEMVRDIEDKETQNEQAVQAARMAAAWPAEMEQEAETGHPLDVQLLKRPLRGLAEEYGQQFPSAWNPPAPAPEENMNLYNIEVKSGSTLRDGRNKEKNKRDEQDEDACQGRTICGGALYHV